jgi:phosphate transport system substrate-binding protein
MPLTQADLNKDGLVQFPTVMGGVVAVMNVDGVAPGALTLDGKTLGDIYMGKVKKWDDAAIAKLNPDLKLPSQAIAVVYRSDGSGTTFVFTDYLAKVNSAFKSDVGVNTSVQWPAGIGGKGNEGVAGTVSQTKGAIGYVEYAYAKQNKLSYTKMINKAGKTVAPTAEAFQAAAANADWAGTPGFEVILTDEPGDSSWPITSATFILMHKQPADAANSAEALKFFDWAYSKGDKFAEDLDYVPMPDNVVALIKKVWADQIKTK